MAYCSNGPSTYRWIIGVALSFWASSHTPVGRGVVRQSEYGTEEREDKADGLHYAFEQSLNATVQQRWP